MSIYGDYLGKETGKLGFGLMRLPKLADDPTKIDLEATKAMVDLFMAAGLTYFDTAFVYDRGDSEIAAGKALVEKYAVRIDYDLHKEVLERYASLHLKPYGGFVNPEIVPVVENGEVVDYQVTYDEDFLGQSLRYGKEYRTL